MNAIPLLRRLRIPTSRGVAVESIRKLWFLRTAFGTNASLRQPVTTLGKTWVLWELTHHLKTAKSFGNQD